MNTRTDEVIYFSVYEPGGKALAKGLPRLMTTKRQ